MGFLCPGVPHYMPDNLQLIHSSNAEAIEQYACSMLLLISHICTHWTIKCNRQHASRFHMCFNFPSLLKITRYRSINEALHSVPRSQDKKPQCRGRTQTPEQRWKAGSVLHFHFSCFTQEKALWPCRSHSWLGKWQKAFILFSLHLLSVPEVLFLHFCNHVESNQQLIEILWHLQVSLLLKPTYMKTIMPYNYLNTAITQKTLQICYR